MKLYYSPFACSLAVHIACREAGIDLTLQRAELQTKRVEGETNLFALNPMGQVPVLVTDAGQALTEVGPILTYVADLTPEKGLAPPFGSFERYEHHRWLSFIGTEVHKKGLSPIFTYGSPEPLQAQGRTALAKPLGVLVEHLATRPMLVGDAFTGADAYLFWALTIAPFGGVPLDGYPALREYQQRLLLRPAVRDAVRFEQAQHQRPFAA